MPDSNNVAYQTKYLVWQCLTDFYFLQPNPMTLLLNTTLVDHDSENESLNTSVQDDSKWESTFSVRHDKDGHIVEHDHKEKFKRFEIGIYLSNDDHIVLNNSKHSTMGTQLITIQRLNGKYLNDNSNGSLTLTNCKTIFKLNKLLNENGYSICHSKKTKYMCSARMGNITMNRNKRRNWEKFDIILVNYDTYEYNILCKKNSTFVYFNGKHMKHSSNNKKESFIIKRSDFETYSMKNFTFLIENDSNNNNNVETNNISPLLIDQKTFVNDCKESQKIEFSFDETVNQLWTFEILNSNAKHSININTKNNTLNNYSNKNDNTLTRTRQTQIVKTVLDRNLLEETLTINPNKQHSSNYSSTKKRRHQNKHFYGKFDFLSGTPQFVTNKVIINDFIPNYQHVWSNINGSVNKYDARIKTCTIIKGNTTVVCKCYMKCVECIIPFKCSVIGCNSGIEREIKGTWNGNILFDVFTQIVTQENDTSCLQTKISG